MGGWGGDGESDVPWERSVLSVGFYVGARPGARCRVEERARSCGLGMQEAVVGVGVGMFALVLVVCLSNPCPCPLWRTPCSSAHTLTGLRLPYHFRVYARFNAVALHG